MKLSIWTVLPQEREGKHTFSGTMYISQGVAAVLRPAELIAIYQTIRLLVKEKGGLDYFQVLINERGEKLYFIDSGDPKDTADDSGTESDNYCTLIYAHEY